MLSKIVTLVMITNWLLCRTIFSLIRMKRELLLKCCMHCNFFLSTAYRLTGKTAHVMNMGSYNYLGFAQPNGPCADDAEKATRHYGSGTCGNRHELGIFSC